MRAFLSRFAVLIVIVLAILAGHGSSFAKKRTSGDVKREQQKTQKQIAQTKKQIAANDRETGRQLDRLTSIKAAIALRGDTIEMLTAKLDSVNALIDMMSDSLGRLEVREKNLKANYAHTLRTIRSRRQGMSDLSFVFSSKSFGQAWRRMRYLREVAKSSTRQAKQLSLAKTEVEKARESLEALRSEQAEAIGMQNAIRTTLRTEQASADNIIKNLKKQGKSLQRELDRRSRQASALAKELDKIVEEEIRLAEERRRKEAAEAERKRKEAEAKAKAEAEAKAKAEAEAKARAEQQADSKTKTDNKAKPKTEKATPAPEKPKTDTPKPSAQTSPAPKKEPAFESEAEKDRRLTGSFESNKGKLLFPVAGRYTVVSNFGTNELPELSKVKVDNLGIDIEVPRGTNARSVFEGVVSSIFRLDGYNNIVIVRHGEYLTVYAGIDALAVKKGDKVKAGQNLGSIFTASGSDRSRLHFEIRHEKQKLNPAEWVK